MPERKYLLANAIDKTMELNFRGCCSHGCEYSASAGANSQWMTVVSRPDPTYRVHVGWIIPPRMAVIRITQEVRPSKVVNSSGGGSHSGKVGQPPDSKHRAGGSNSKC